MRFAESVRQGEHSQVVVFWKVDQIPNVHGDTDSEKDDADEKQRRRFVLNYYRLFNLGQCELPQTVLDKLPKSQTHQHDPIEAAEQIMARMPNPPEIKYAGSKAFYSPVTDHITLPPRELFTSTEEIYASLSMRPRTRLVRRSGSTANRSAKPRRSGRPCTVSRSSSRNVQPLICAPKRESRRPF